MRVTVSVYGRFHAFDLARELEHLGALERLITSYPARIAERFGIPRERTQSLLPLEAWGRLTRRLPRGPRELLEPLGHAAFARWASRCLPESPEVFVGWSGSSLAALQAARRRGALTVLERGSAHIDAQAELLTQAYASAGLRPSLPPSSIMARERAEYQSADLIAVPSPFVAETFLQRGFSREKLLINPYGVDLTRFQPAGELPPGLKLLFVGRASIRKGAHLLLEAFAGWRDPQASLTFVGPVESELEPYFARWADARVRRIGVVPQAALAEHYRAANLFCLPSFEEGMAMVLFQAAACGLPLLISANTGGTALLDGGRAGWLLADSSVAALQAGFAAALAAPGELAAKGQAARALVQAGYGWQDYGRRAWQAYGEHLAKRQALQNAATGGAPAGQWRPPDARAALRFPVDGVPAPAPKRPAGAPGFPSRQAPAASPELLSSRDPV